MNLPPIDLLREQHSFPGVFVFKVIGRAAADGEQTGFVARVIHLVRDELSLDEDPRYRFRNTSSAKYVSVTIEPIVESAEQVLALYSRLSQLDDVLMLL